MILYPEKLSDAAPVHHHSWHTLVAREHAPIFGVEGNAQLAACKLYTAYVIPSSIHID